MAFGVIQRTGCIFDAVQLTNLSDEPGRFSERFLQCLVEVPSGVRKAPDSRDLRILLDYRFVHFIGIGLDGALESLASFVGGVLAANAAKLQTNVFPWHRVKPPIALRGLTGHIAIQ